MLGLLLRNASFTVPHGFSDIYPDFQPLRPGEFRNLMQLSKRRVLAAETVVTREGARLDHIYYVISGMPVVTKMGTSFPMAERIFVGEVAYLTGKGSAATTTLPKGAEVLEWDLGKLSRAAARRPHIKLALDAVISRDLARKVALAVAPAARQLAREQAE
jgi:CRP-like cAMP-binding protein